MKLKSDNKYLWVKTKTLPQSIFKPDNIVNTSLSEIIYSFLAQKIGLDVVTVVPSVSVNKNGISKTGSLIQNFSSVKNAEAILGKHFLAKFAQPHFFNHSALNYKKAFENCSKQKTKKTVSVQPNYLNQLYLQYLLDVLTFNIDRHGSNIVVIKSEDRNSISYQLSKAFDNSFAFLLNAYNANEIYYKAIEDEKLGCYNFKFTLNPVKQDKEADFAYCANELAELMTVDKPVRKAFEKLHSLAIKDVITEVKQAYPKYKIDEKNIKYLSQVYAYTTKKIESCYQIALSKQQSLLKSKIQAQVSDNDYFL